MEITALAVSRHAVQGEGPLQCVGHFRNAINFLTADGLLLTLHREGRGLSPMGWELGDDDFDDVADALAESAACRLTPAGIALDGMTIRPSARRSSLHLPPGGETAAAPLASALAAVSAETGLFGRLDRIVARPPEGEVRELQQLFAAWLRGAAVDWSHVLGKGPGLTPGNDDTVLGMLFCAWLDRRVTVADLPPFFAASQPLDVLTTRVSVSYLRFAADGIFATPLQQFARALFDARALPAAVDALLTLGHSSGADTLLGIWSGIRVINELY